MITIEKGNEVFEDGQYIAQIIKKPLNVVPLEWKVFYTGGDTWAFIGTATGNPGTEQLINSIAEIVGNYRNKNLPGVLFCFK